ncbi:hypothetical protein MNBD_GAMMA09-2766 [hydrothermal vent metagenome]|uniref:Antitoxin n=1 Tax=hydrothermal vent metagenome TaxID=652676 RepID=A0A3B0XRE2_9ZZZZ
MSIDEYKEKDVTDIKSIKVFIESIESQQRELILTSSGKTAGAILTAEQYEWFLNQLDEQQDTSFVEERTKDLDGSQSLDEFKKELEE